jgi:transcriptional regulator with XRE-family HTH domain
MAASGASPTLGHVLSQARSLLGLSLRQAAARLHHADNRPISPRYLHMLEQDRRRPSLHLTRQLASMFALDEAFLIAAAHQTDALLRRYLQTRPECEWALAEMVLRAEERGFVAWERVTQHIVAMQGAAASQGMPRTSRAQQSKEKQDARTPRSLPQYPHH